MYSLLNSHLKNACTKKQNKQSFSIKNQTVNAESIIFHLIFPSIFRFFGCYWSWLFVCLFVYFFFIWSHTKKLIHMTKEYERYINLRTNKNHKEKNWENDLCLFLDALLLSLFVFFIYYLLFIIYLSTLIRHFHAIQFCLYF